MSFLRKVYGPAPHLILRSNPLDWFLRKADTVLNNYQNQSD